MVPPTVRSQMACASYRYYWWLFVAVTAFVVSVVVNLLDPVRGNYLMTALQMWWSNLDLTGIVGLVNLFIVTTAKMYLALIVYANFAIEFITTVWWQDAHDEPDVQNARTEEYLQMYQCFDSNAKSAGGPSGGLAACDETKSQLHKLV